jgi:formylglycine-generating enzyme required for sulfatase activity
VVPDSLEACVLRVITESGEIAGGAVLVSDRHVVTCAHVAGPSGTVRLDAPRIPAAGPLEARVIRWAPPRPDGVDVAVLELTGPAPAEARPAPLSREYGLWHHRFRVLGFPPGHEGGIYATGEVLGRGEGGWTQLEDLTTTGLPIQPGFSGAPVWDEALEAVVGIVVAAVTDDHARTGFLIPVDVIEGVWPPLAEAVPADPVRRHVAALLAEERYARWSAPERAVPVRVTRYRSPAPRPQPLREAIAGHRCVVLLGAAGAGKTTALEILAGDAASGLPVLVELRDFAGQRSLLPLIRDALRGTGVLRPGEDEVEELLDHEDCVVLCDGLSDAGPDAPIGVALRQLAGAHPRVRVIVTCRSADFADFAADLDRFMVLEIAPWRLDQITRFLSAGGAGNGGVSPAALVRLVRTDDSSILSNPLLLSLASRTPSALRPHARRADVLREYLAGDRVSGRVPVRDGLRDKLVPTARRLAYAARQRRERRLGVDAIFEEIVAERGARGYRAEDMYAALRGTDLLVADAEYGWFRHEYVAEFLAAEQLRRRAPADEVAGLATDGWWRPIVTLYLSLDDLQPTDLRRFLVPAVDRWVRYLALTELGARGDDPCASAMIHVPGGRVVIGRDGGAADEAPAHEVVVAPFDIDAVPVTNGQYAQFAAATGRPMPPSAADGRRAAFPVTDVAWADAREYAAWAGKRLPTEAEWETAATWFVDGLKWRWPWGDAFSPDRLNSDTAARSWVGGPTPVGMYPDGASRYGVLDLVGNVWEWTSSLLRPYPYDPADGREDPADPGLRVVRGGSWRSTSPDFVTGTKRDAFLLRPSLGGNVGFRCARDTAKGGERR